MKIGFIVSSFKQSITYISCLVSLGYQVIPIVLNKDVLTSENDFIINIIRDIVNGKILFIDDFSLDEKLDTVIVMNDYNTSPINYLPILKDGAPIILNLNNYHNNSLTDYTNIHITACNSQDIIENCNNVVSSLEKVLKK